MATEQNDIQIFLSYTKADQDNVLHIYQYLIENGYVNTWIDCKKILPGQKWDLEIQKNLRKSDIIIIFLSHNSISKRGYVQRELKIALKYLEEKLDDDIYVIPIKIDSDVDIPDGLDKIQYLDLNESSAFGELIKSLAAQTEKLGKETSKVIGDDDKIFVTKKEIKERWEGLPGYEVEFSVPLFQSSRFNNLSEVTKLIEANFTMILQSYRRNKIEQATSLYSWMQDTYLRTNTFYAYCDNIFHRHFFLSILYTAHWYGAGAAHPNHYFKTFNFILNPLIEINKIEEIFEDSHTCFEEFILLVRTELNNILVTENNGDAVKDEKLLDMDWIKSGTADWNCLNAFTLSDHGLGLYFPPYQVGPYACGSHHIILKFQHIFKFLNSDIKNALLLSRYIFDDNSA
ncbi:MAG: TIR domain-containing protein [Bacteroidetes bacterium]|nr:TIR domain-containing protein [Bacteroidota bacterium]